MKNYIYRRVNLKIQGTYRKFNDEYCFYFRNECELNFKSQRIDAFFE